MKGEASIASLEGLLYHASFKNSNMFQYDNGPPGGSGGGFHGVGYGGDISGSGFQGNQTGHNNQGNKGNQGGYNHQGNHQPQ